MKANELRLGNLVYDRGNKLIRIDWFERDKVCMRMQVNNQEVHPLTEYFEYLKPVPLSEERLVKAGLRLIEESKSKFPFHHVETIIKTYSLNPFNLDDELDLVIEVVKDGEDKEIRRIGIKGVEFMGCIDLQYVHTFQNTVFALTGEELEFKL